MSNFYKIEGENEFAYFRANYKQLEHLLDDDRFWAVRIIETGVLSHFYFSDGERVRRNALYFRSKVEKRGKNYFIARGTLYFCYRVEAVSENISRIIPLGKLSLGRKIWVPCELLIMFIFPIIFAPLVYLYWKWETKNKSKEYLEALCQYLERKGKEKYMQAQPKSDQMKLGQRQQGEIKQ